MSEPRRYAGQSGEERQLARRERIIEAGLEMFGTTGFAAASIEKLCARAAISNRYFYAEFSSREALLKAVYLEVLRDASQSGLAAMLDELPPVKRIAAGVQAYVLVMTSDPRRTRVVHHEVRAVPEMAEQRRRTAEWVADFFRRHAGVEADPSGAPFAPGLAILGATSELLARWTTAPLPRPPVGPLAQTLSDFTTAALSGYLDPASSTGPARGA